MPMSPPRFPTATGAASLLLSLLMLGTAAQAQAADTIRSGTLLFEVADGESVEVPRLQTDVRVTVDGVIAHVEIRQRFRNPTDLSAGAIYAFPLPANAVVDHLRTEAGQQVLTDVRRKVSTHQLHEQTSQSASPRQPLLLRAPLADIAPNADIDITIGYVQAVEQRAGRHTLRVPLAANAPRLTDINLMQDPFARAPAHFLRTALGAGSTANLHQVSVQVMIDAGVPVTGISSPHHSIRVLAAKRSMVTTQGVNTAPEHDFVLSWIPEPAKARPLPLSKPAPSNIDGLPVSFAEQPLSLRHEWAPLNDAPRGAQAPAARYGAALINLAWGMLGLSIGVLLLTAFRLLDMRRR